MGAIQSPFGSGGGSSTQSLDQIATAHPTAANWSNNNFKITSLAANSAPGDAMAQPVYQFEPEAYGAKGDLQTFTDGVMTNGTAILTSATANFTSADVGKAIIVNVGAAGANQAPLITTILSQQSSTQVTLNANAPAGATGNPFAYGTDDTAAVQSAWAAAQVFAYANPQRSALLYLNKMYVMATAPVKGQTTGAFVNSYGYSMLPINVPDLTGALPKVNLIIDSPFPGDEPNYFEQHTGQIGRSGIFAMLAAPSTDATWGIPSIVGGPTAASGTWGSLSGGFANIRLHLGNVKFVVPYNPGWIGADARFLAAASGDRYGYQMFAVGALSSYQGPALNSVPAASWNFNGSALRCPVMNNNDLIDFGSIMAEGVADAVWIADHFTCRSLKTINNANGIVFDNTNGSGSGALHGSWIGYWSAEGQTNNVLIVSGSKVSTFPIVVGHLDSENSTTPALINDSGIFTGQIHWYDIGGSTIPKISGSTRIEVISHKALGPSVWGSPPAVPATTVAVAASALPNRHAMVNVQPGAATITSITVGATVMSGVTSGWVPVPSLTSITLAYTGGTPTWQWVLF